MCEEYCTKDWHKFVLRYQNLKTRFLEHRSSTAKHSEICVRKLVDSLLCSMRFVYWGAAWRTSGKRTWGDPLPLIELFCIFDQSSYDELKIFPTITTLDEKQAKHLASGQEDKLITREERTVCYWFILITPYTDSMKFRKRIKARTSCWWFPLLSTPVFWPMEII